MNPRPRLLLFEPRRLGDSILSLPLVRSALSIYDVYVCCSPASQPIYATLLPEDRILTAIPPWEQSGLRGWVGKEYAEQRDRLKNLKLEVVTSVWPDPRVHLWMNLVGAKTRIGFPMTRRNYYGWERPWRGRQLRLGRILNLLLSVILCRPLLTRSLHRQSAEQSHLENWHQIAHSLGLSWEVQTPWFPVQMPTSETIWGSWIARARAQGRTIWLIHTGAHSPVRRWSLEKFSALVDQWPQSENRALIFISGPGEPGLTTTNNWHLSPVPSSLAELFAITAQVDQVLCHDSMMAHLAAALGKKVFTLFGPQNPQWFAPFGQRQRVINRNVCPHRPCFDRCVFPSPICLEAITVDDVIEAINRGSD